MVSSELQIRRSLYIFVSILNNRASVNLNCDDIYATGGSYLCKLNKHINFNIPLHILGGLPKWALQNFRINISHLN